MKTEPTLICGVTLAAAAAAQDFAGAGSKPAPLVTIWLAAADWPLLRFSSLPHTAIPVLCSVANPRGSGIEETSEARRRGCQDAELQYREVLAKGHAPTFRYNLASI